METRRISLAALNLAAKPLSDQELRVLDGSIKKNTAFIRKLKTFTTDQLDTLLGEARLLKLEKYQQEIATAILESKFKTQADIYAAVELCSFLHQRFPEFSIELVELTRRMIGPPPTYKGVAADQRDREELIRIQKQKTAMRLLTEFKLVCIFDLKRIKAAQYQSYLADLFTTDKELNNLSLATAFCKAYSNIYLDPTDTLISDADKSFIAVLFNNYFEHVSSTLSRVHQRIKDVEKFNTDYLMTKGELSEERKEAYIVMQATFARLLAGAKILSAQLALPMPPLQEAEDTTRIGIGISAAGDESQGEYGIWDDEESKLLYEDIIDIKSCVPASMLGERVEAVDDGKTALDFGSFEIDSDADLHFQHEEEDDARYALVSSAVSGQSDIDMLLHRLLLAQNSSTIDKIIIDYLFLHTKYNKGKLLKALMSIPRNRTDLVPLYSRLIATLNPYFPEIGTEVTQYLESQVKRLFRKTAAFLFAEKIKVIAYVGELVKFRVAPWYLVFGSLNYLFANFAISSNIELFTALLENCGRFMLKNPISSERVVATVESMMRMKAAKALDTRECLLIDNAYFSVYPPTRSAFEEIILPPHEAYARHLIYEKLDVDTAEIVLTQLLKYDWTDPDVIRIMNYCFTNVWWMKYSNIDCLAWIVAELYEFYPGFCIDVVDGVCERVRDGIEKNLFKDNQKRIATIKFLGEIFNYFIVSSALIFDTLFLLTQYEDGVSRPDVHCAIDPPYDFFRVRLACMLLETVGSNFARGKLAIKLDQFLVFFQLYIYSKADMPMEIEYLVCDVLDELRPKMQILASYKEAVAEVNRISLLLKESHARPETVEVQDLSIEEDPDQASQSDHSVMAESEIVDEDTSLQAIQDAVDEADFDVEYAKLMQDSLDGRKFEKKQQSIDIPLPLRRTILDQADSQNPEHILFSVLSRKGNKQQVSQVELPSESHFAVTTRTKLIAEGIEKQEVKKSVLAYEAREYTNEVPTVVEGDASVKRPVPHRVLPPPRIRRLGDDGEQSALFQSRGYYTYSFHSCFLLLARRDRWNMSWLGRARMLVCGNEDKTYTLQSR